MRTIANMVEQLSDNFEFWIVTRDRDLLDNAPYSSVPINQWCKVGKAQVYYCSVDQRSIEDFTRLVNDTSHDALYLNSFFDPDFTLKLLLARYLRKIPLKPLILAPRGEFSAGALKLKRFKKTLFIFLSRFSKLYKNITWQASSEHEVKDIIKYFKVNPETIMIASNLPAIAGYQSHNENLMEVSNQTNLRVVFLSRISPKKNLDYALKTFVLVKANIQFDIYGPAEDAEYWKVCQMLVNSVPENIRITYCGSIVPEEVANVFSKYDLFFFPTRGENYGHVIAESLSVGTPVLISDQTPWRDLDSDRLGWDIPLENMEGFANIIELCSRMIPDEKKKWRSHIKDKIVERLTDPKVLEANRQLFLHAMEK